MSMFARAKELPSAPKKKARVIDTTIPIEGLEEYTYVDSAIKSWTAIKKTLEFTVKSKIREVFMDSCHGKRPDNFRGSEGVASASCELRKRSSVSVLNDDECELLDQHSIPYDTVSDIPETLVINPDCLDWLYKNSAKVEKALKTIKDLPEDFFLKQKAQPKRIVSDETIIQVFKNKETADKCLDTVCVLAIKPKLEVEFDTKEFIKILGGK